MHSTLLNNNGQPGLFEISLKSREEVLEEKKKYILEELKTLDSAGPRNLIRLAALGYYLAVNHNDALDKKVLELMPDEPIKT